MPELGMPGSVGAAGGQLPAATRPRLMFGPGLPGSAGFPPASVEDPPTSARARMPAIPGGRRSGTPTGSG